MRCILYATQRCPIVKLKPNPRPRRVIVFWCVHPWLEDDSESLRVPVAELCLLLIVERLE